jgi:hypothetical protein
MKISKLNCIPGKLLFWLIVPVALIAQEKEGSRPWIDTAKLTVEGKGWQNTQLPFDRLPAKAESLVRKPLWNLSHNTAGVSIRFVSDATTLKVRWKLQSSDLAMPHMPATGVSGLDLYVKFEGQWRWLAAGRPMHFPDNEATLFSDILPGKREYVLYLPLYNSAVKVELAIEPGASLEPAPARSTRPIVWYGTSITQGGCASRPGMAASNILSRRLNREIINLGFSGYGVMDPEMAHLLAELDPAIYLLANQENISPGEVYARATAFVTTLLAAHPETPIVIIENIRNNNAFLHPRTNGYIIEKRRELQRAFHTLQMNGAHNLHYVYGDVLYGNDGEATVDGEHATDVGFLRQADALEPLLKQLLGNGR